VHPISLTTSWNQGRGGRGSGLSRQHLNGCLPFAKPSVLGGGGWVGVVKGRVGGSVWSACSHEDRSRVATAQQGAIEDVRVDEPRGGREHWAGGERAEIPRREREDTVARSWEERSARRYGHFAAIGRRPRQRAQRCARTRCLPLHSDMFAQRSLPEAEPPVHRSELGPGHPFGLMSAWMSGVWWMV